MIKLDRFFAWVLYVSMLAYFISGYSMTKGIIDAKTGTYLHTKLLPYLIVIAFLCHTGYAIHLAFKRWRIWNNGTKILLVLIYLLLLGLFIFVESFYLENKENNNSSNQVTQPINSNANNNVPDSMTNKTDTENTITNLEDKYFTVDELAKYNGENGMPAYVAVDGVVYDMSSVFISGTHYSHYAGTELTEEFYSRHSKSEITKYPIVGKLK